MKKKLLNMILLFFLLGSFAMGVLNTYVLHKFNKELRSISSLLHADEEVKQAKQKLREKQQIPEDI